MKYPECEQMWKNVSADEPYRQYPGGNIQISVGMLTGSKGLVADGVHSIADSFASAFILVSLNIAEKPQDQDHPYG